MNRQQDRMRAGAVVPGKPHSAYLVDMDRPEPAAGEALMRTVRVGVDGTDAEIDAALYGEAPEGSPFLVIGHESLARVERAPEGDDSLGAGNYVVATVRRPCDLPCHNCTGGQSDMCLTGRYVERGIKGRHGYMSEYYVESPTFLVRVPDALRDLGVLVEPLSIAEKGVWQSWKLQERLMWEPKAAVVLGVGTLGLLTTFLLRLRGLTTYAVGRRDPATDPRVALVEEAGATYINTAQTPIAELAGSIGAIDFIFEATGSASASFEAMQAIGRNGVLCLTGVTGGAGTLEVPAEQINLELVLGNKVVFGTVNSNRAHFQRAVEDLGQMADRWPGLLEKLFTRRVPLEEFPQALRAQKGDIKVTVEVSGD